MIRRVQQLYGDTLGATDGDIGQVKACYFDDQNWVVRYLVADTGSWLSGRQVLISPHAVGSHDRAKKRLAVNLTRKQIEDSPSIESHKPVSRHYEEEYYRYYGWPYYWQGGALWGMSGFPAKKWRYRPVRSSGSVGMNPPSSSARPRQRPSGVPRALWLPSVGQSEQGAGS